MAIAAPTVWEFRTSGNNNNGGGCVWTSLVNSTYKWTLSGSGTNEYYVELAAGGDPSLTEAINAQLDGKFNIATNGTVGSLNASEWDWGDNDTLGYSTVYVRLSDGVDPDTKAPDFVGMVKGGGTDYSQQDSAQLNNSDFATSGTGVTTLTSATGGFTAAMVSSIINLPSGTNLLEGEYEITVYTDTNTVTLDRAPDDGVGGVSGASGYVGGAKALPTDAFFEQCVAGNKALIKNTGTYTLTASISVAKDGTSVDPIIVEGYNATRGDNPTGTNRPLVACGTYEFIFDNFWIRRNLRLTGTSDSLFRADSGSRAENCKVENSSGTANRNAFLAATGHVYNCEAISTNGRGVHLGVGAAGSAVGSYIHDSDIGIYVGGSDSLLILLNVIDTCTTAVEAGSNAELNNMFLNTLYNGTTGLLMGTSCDRWQVQNNIIDSFTTGASAGDEQKINWFDYNNWYNNTTDVSNVTKGDNALALDPSFTDAANANFSIGTNLKAGAFPGAFPGAHASCIGYLDVGAVQRQEPAGGGGLIVHPGMDGGMNA